MSSTAVTEDIGSSLINLNICLITFSTIFIVTRCYVRTVMLKSVSWDDAFALVAWVGFAERFEMHRAWKLTASDRSPGTINPRNRR